KVRQRTLAPALIGLRMGGADAECEGGIGVEEELVHVVVVNDEEEVWPDLIEPGAGRNVAGEQWRPERLLLLSSIPRHPNRRSVRGADTTDRGRHGQCAFRAWYSANVMPAEWAPISGRGTPTAAPIFSMR